MQELGPETALTVDDFSVRRGEDMIDLHFEIVNSGDAKLYEFVKMYVGSFYVGLEYMHLEPGERHIVEFQANARTVSPDDSVLLTTDTKEEGVIFDKGLGELLSIPEETEEPEEPEQAVAGEPRKIREELEQLKERDIPEERWEQLEEEFEELQGEEREEKQKILERLREEYRHLTADEEASDEDTEGAGERPAERPQERPETHEDREMDERPAERPSETVESHGETSESSEDTTEERPERSSEEVEEPSSPERPSEGRPEEEGPTAETLEHAPEEDVTEASRPDEDATAGRPDDGQEQEERSETVDTVADTEAGEPPQDEAVGEETATELEEPPGTEPGDARRPAARTDEAEGPEEPLPSEDEVERKVREFEEQREDREEAGSNVVRSVVDHIFGSSREGQEEPDKPDVSEQEDDEDMEQDDEEDEGYEYEDEEQLPPSMQVDRVTTGVDGLDEKMQGGLVQGTMNLVTGKTGTGKTAFCANFLKGGADEGEAGVYVTTEERQEDIRADIEAMFGWSFDQLEEEGKVKILSIKPIFPSKEIDNLNRLVRSYISNLLDQVMQAVEEIDADRVIIDSVSIIEMFIRDEYMARVALASLLNKLREANVTAVLTGTVPETSEGLSGGGIIEFLVDTVILLEFVPVAEEHKRTMTIRKMRRTDHRTEIFPFDITPDGIKIFDVGG